MKLVHSRWSQSIEGTCPSFIDFFSKIMIPVQYHVTNMTIKQLKSTH